MILFFPFSLLDGTYQHLHHFNEHLIPLPSMVWKKKTTPLPHPSPKLEFNPNQQHTLTI
jgi:hypothetical protein